MTGALDAARDVTGTAGHLTLTLPAAVTEALLTRVPAAFHGGINDVLLTGLALAVADWCRRQPGRDAGRGGGLGVAAMRCCWMSRATAARRCSADVDLSRTVGWFTSLLPGAARCRRGSILRRRCAAGRALGRALKTIKEQLRAVPREGAGLWAAALSQRARRRRRSRALPAPQLGVQLSGALCGRRRSADWSAAAEDGGRLGGGDPAMPLAHAIEVDALTLDGAAGPELVANWSFAPALLTEAAVRELAERWFRALTALVRACRAGRAPAVAARAICRWLR